MSLALALGRDTLSHLCNCLSACRFFLVVEKRKMLGIQVAYNVHVNHACSPKQVRLRVTIAFLHQPDIFTSSDDIFKTHIMPLVRIRHHSPRDASEEHENSIYQRSFFHGSTGASQYGPFFSFVRV